MPINNCLCLCIYNNTFHLRKSWRAWTSTVIEISINHVLFTDLCWYPPTKRLFDIIFKNALFWDEILKREQQQQQVTKLWRVHRGTLCSRISPAMIVTLPTQTNEGTSQLQHDTRAYVPSSFRIISWVLLASPSNWCRRVNDTRLMVYNRRMTRSHELRKDFHETRGGWAH